MTRAQLNAAVVVGRYTCPACPRRFRTLAEKKNHVKSQHPKKGGKS